MGQASLYRRIGSASQDELIELIRDQPGQPCWLFQETTDLVDFKQVDENWLSELPDGLWPLGRVFGPLAEVRWWQEVSGYEILVLREESDQSLADQSNWQMDLFVTEDESYPIYLWGERKLADPQAGRSMDDPYWIETRIPRPLRYPLEQWDGLPYVTVLALNYYQNGILRLTRLVGLATSDGSQGG